MQRMSPMKALVRVIKGRKKHDMVIYVQSKLSASTPSPSFPLAPPNMLVNTKLFLLARQKKLTPVRKGAMYCGKSS